MNSTLIVANAIALAVVLGVHFAPENTNVAANNRTPHYLQLQRAPQLAVVTHETHVLRQQASQAMQVAAAQSADRLIF